MENYKEMLAETKQTTGQMSREYPGFFKGLAGFSEAVHAGGALPTKTKELIAVALAVVKQCKYCIAFHVSAALQAGASQDEIMESTFVAALMGGGPAYMYAKQVRKAIDDLRA